MLVSSVCKYEDFFTDWYRNAAEMLRLEPMGFDAHRYGRNFQRKHWEWCAIVQVLRERRMLTPGKTGCGFAVGQEPLVSLFARHGVGVLATDMPPDADHLQTSSAADWASTGQYAASLETLHQPDIVSRAQFDACVRYRPVDMRDIGLPWEDRFDFLWSSCSIEHLGSLRTGIDFVLASTGLLKPGGIAVHTTEINVASNDETIVEGPSVIYRRRDIEQLDYELRRLRCGLSRCDFFAGDDLWDIQFDKDPFVAPQPLYHLKLCMDGHITTSMVLIIRKGAE